MRFQVIMKDPGALSNAIDKAISSYEDWGKRDDLLDLCKLKWFRYGEYLKVEVDTEAQTIAVVPN